MTYKIDYKKVVDTARVLSDRIDQVITPDMVYSELQNHAEDVENHGYDYQTWLDTVNVSVMALWLQRLYNTGILFR